jgi:aminopeptidase N
VIAAGITGLTKLASDEGSKVLTTLDEDTKNHVVPLIKRFSNQK